MTPNKTSASARLRKILEGFIGQLPDQMAAIRRQLGSLDQASPSFQAGLEDFHRALHTLKGSSAAVDLKGVSRAAQAAEDLAKAVKSRSVDPASGWRAEMENHLKRIDRAVAVACPDAQTSLMKLDLAAAEILHGAAERKIIYLCEDDPFQLFSLAEQIGCFGFDVSAFTSLDEFYEAVRRITPRAIVMDMIHPEDKTGGAQIIQRIRAESGARIPAVFISSDEGIETRLAAVRAGCDAYFVKPIDPNHLCATLHAITCADAPEQNRIMIVDDDPRLSGLYEAILREAGMETLAVNDPMAALPLIGDFKPDLILLDMHMPGCNGMELAAVIRQIEQYISIPIIFLSSETDETLHMDAKRMGGDEFLLKSIKPELLVMNVAARARRMKILRAYMVRDSLTGLYNHSNTKDHLEKCVSQAMRSGENVCFAMLDLDNFKGVNDRYGHPTGDRVLVALANLLNQRLRRSDIVGRYGGEEFAVILPRASMSEAVATLDTLRKGFEAIRFPVPGGHFSATFSCGVASLALHDSFEKLCLAADQALYQAKYEGRNRVLGAESFLPADRMREMTALVVEDAEPVRAVIVEMLEAMGFRRVLAAGQGLEALETLKTGEIDIILADWHMPVMNGLELLKAVKADPALAWLPFLMITGEDDKGSVREALQVGVSDYILKPVFAEELSKKIIRALCRPGHKVCALKSRPGAGEATT